MVYSHKLFFVFVLQMCAVFAKDMPKSRLFFVIDDSGSMFQELNQIKTHYGTIFEKYKNSVDSRIQSFGVVTFNDPMARVLVIAEDLHSIQSALNSIIVDGGMDCPEYAMTGIKLALDNSLPNSIIYVFTDASAKDYAMYEDVKALALRKQVQINFVLTDTCTDRADEGYQVFVKLAAVTKGQLFDMTKDDVQKVLETIGDTKPTSIN